MVQRAARRAAWMIVLVTSSWPAAAAAICNPLGPQILRPGRLLTRLASDPCNPALDFRIRMATRQRDPHAARAARDRGRADREDEHAAGAQCVGGVDGGGFGP